MRGRSFLHRTWCFWVVALALFGAGCDGPRATTSAPAAPGGTAASSANTLPIEIDTRIVPSEDWDKGTFVAVFTLPKSNAVTYRVYLSSDQAGTRMIGQPLSSQASELKTLRLRDVDLKGVQRIWVQLRSGANDPVEAVHEARVDGAPIPKAFACAGSFEIPALRDEIGGVAFATPVSFTLTLED